MIHFIATGTLEELPISDMTLYHSLNISTSIIFPIVLQLATDAIESIPFEYLFNNEITMKQLRALVLVWPNLRFKCESPDMTFGIAEKFSGGNFVSSKNFGDGGEWPKSPKYHFKIVFFPFHFHKFSIKWFRKFSHRIRAERIWSSSKHSLTLTTCKKPIKGEGISAC